MAWEKIEAKRPGTKGHNFPVLAVGSSGVTINQVGCEAFGLKKGDYVHMLFDREHRRIGIKKATTGEDIIGAYRLGTGGGNKEKKWPTRSLKASCYRLVKLIPDCYGRRFRCILNSGERVIEVSLNPDNMVA